MRRSAIAVSTAALMITGGVLMAGCGIDADVAASTVAGKSPAPQGATTSPTVPMATPTPEEVPETTLDPTPELPAPSPELAQERVHESGEEPVEGPVDEPVELAGYVQPGNQILNLDNGYACSAGWFAGVGDRRFVITAGHCGAAGHLFAAAEVRATIPSSGPWWSPMSMVPLPVSSGRISA